MQPSGLFFLAGFLLNAAQESVAQNCHPRIAGWSAPPLTFYEQ